MKYQRALGLTSERSWPHLIRSLRTQRSKDRFLLPSDMTDEPGVLRTKQASVRKVSPLSAKDRGKVDRRDLSTRSTSRRSHTKIRSGQHPTFKWTGENSNLKLPKRHWSSVKVKCSSHSPRMPTCWAIARWTSEWIAIAPIESKATQKYQNRIWTQFSP